MNDEPRTVDSQESDLFTDAELLAWLDEALPAERMSALEAALRQQSALHARLTQLVARRDAGLHTLADLWRRNQLSCPSRERLGSYLLALLDAGEASYIRFHVEVIGCRICEANLADLAARGAAPSQTAEQRRQRYFQSSAGKLRR